MIQVYTTNIIIKLAMINAGKKLFAKNLVILMFPDFT